MTAKKRKAIRRTVRTNTFYPNMNIKTFTNSNDLNKGIKSNEVKKGETVIIDERRYFCKNCGEEVNVALPIKHKCKTSSLIRKVVIGYYNSLFYVKVLNFDIMLQLVNIFFLTMLSIIFKIGVLNLKILFKTGFEVYAGTAIITFSLIFLYTLFMRLHNYFVIIGILILADIFTLGKSGILAVANKLLIIFMVINIIIFVTAMIDDIKNKKKEYIDRDLDRY